MKYLGLAFSHQMIENGNSVSFKEISVDEVRRIVDKGEFVNCCNKFHIETLVALDKIYGINLFKSVPEVPPHVHLVAGDTLILTSVVGLPRLTEHRGFTQEEIDGATFAFRLLTVT